tara:strand:- start:4366 stop:4482 length:117 start_codon:yes stop_codon:yes gene_type:complete
MLRTGYSPHHDQLVPAKYIFGESAAAWLGSIQNQQRVT